MILIRFYDWLTFSLDLNLIENVCGEIIRDVYNDGKQIANMVELRSAVSNAWFSIFNGFCRNLVKYMRKSCTEVLEYFGRENYY